MTTNCLRALLSSQFSRYPIALSSYRQVYTHRNLLQVYLTLQEVLDNLADVVGDLGLERDHTYRKAEKL